MGTPQEHDPVRRRMLLAGPAALLGVSRVIGGTPQSLASVILAAAIETACQVQTPTKEQQGQAELFTWKERGEQPASGDIVVVDGAPFLLDENSRYVVPDLNRYIKSSKFTDYGGRVFTTSVDRYRQYPIIDLSNSSTVLNWIIDINPNIQDKDAVRRRLDNKLRYGGEMLVFFPGFMTDDGDVYDVAKPRVDTFTTFIKGLASRGWGFEDCLFFNYGEQLWIDSYDTKNTGRYPGANIKLARDFLRALKKEFPLVRFNIVGHSLGALLTLAAVMEHYDRVNNVVLINGPVNGIEGTVARRALIAGLKNTYFRLKGLGDEQTTDFLYNLWENNFYRPKVDRFTSYLASQKRKVTDVVDEGDEIVPPESSLISSAEIVRLRFKDEDVPAYNVKEKVEQALKKHGRPLKNELVIRRIGERFGQDLADAA